MINPQPTDFRKNLTLARTFPMQAITDSNDNAFFAISWIVSAIQGIILNVAVRPLTENRFQMENDVTEDCVSASKILNELEFLSIKFLQSVKSTTSSDAPENYGWTSISPDCSNIRKVSSLCDRSSESISNKSSTCDTDKLTSARALKRCQRT